MGNSFSSRYTPRLGNAIGLFAGIVSLALLSACGSHRVTNEKVSEAVAKPDMKTAQTEARTSVKHTLEAKPGDEKLVRGTVSIDHVGDSNIEIGGEILLTIRGTLPTPCHELRLRIPAAASADGVVRVEAWSVTDPGAMCAQVLHPFSVQIPVPKGLGSKIVVNGKP